MRILPLFLMFVAAACSNEPSHADLNGFGKMEGNWLSQQEGKTFSETWKITGDRMHGQGYLVEGNDTLFGEKLVVEKINGKLVYIADVPGQSPTLFICTAQDNKSWRFESPGHDFPSLIVYEYRDEKNLRVLLEGTEGGRKIKEELIFKRQ